MAALSYHGNPSICIIDVFTKERASCKDMRRGKVYQQVRVAIIDNRWFTIHERLIDSGVFHRGDWNEGLITWLVKFGT